MRVQVGVNLFCIIRPQCTMYPPRPAAVGYCKTSYAIFPLHH